MSIPKFVTIGCRLNTYETEAMRELINDENLKNIAVINTCAVTAQAVRKSKQEIRKIHRENPKTKIVVTGCAHPVTTILVFGFSL